MKHESTEYIEYLETIHNKYWENYNKDPSEINWELWEKSAFALDAYMSFLKIKSEVLNSNCN